MVLAHLVIRRIAPLLFGVLLNVLLFGVFIVQVTQPPRHLVSAHPVPQVYSYFRLDKTCVSPSHAPASCLRGSYPIAMLGSDIWYANPSSSADDANAKQVYYLILMETVNTICDIGVIYEPLITLHRASSHLLLLYCLEHGTALQSLPRPQSLFVSDP